MTDPAKTEKKEPEIPEKSSESELISKLRDEFATEIATLKSSIEAVTKEKDAKIAELEKQNSDLKRSLIRDAVANPQPTVEKTEEELYQERISELAKKTLVFMGAKSS